jgi:hypothetical protein
MRVQHSNSRIRELRVVLALIPSRWLCVEGTNKEDPYPYRILGIGVWRKRSQGSSTHKLMRSRVMKGTCAKVRLWSHGDVRLMLVLSCAG